MDEQNLPFLEDDQPEVQAEPEGEQPKEPEQGVAPKEPEPEAKTEPPAVEEKSSSQVPITALLDERDKRKRAQQEAEYYRRLAEQAQKPPEKPDPYDDPEKFAAHQQQMIEHALWNERLNMSETLVREKLGDETVDAATQAFQQAMQQNPALYAEMRQSRNPYGYVVDWHKKQTFLSEVGDPDTWRKQREAEIRAQLEAEFAQKAPSKPAAPPRSLARAPSAGGEANPPGSAFDELFPG